MDLAPYNTFRLPGRAERWCAVESLADIARLRADPAWAGAPRLVLGGGSNLLVQGDVPGWVLKVVLRGRRLLETRPEAWLVEAAAGENWHDFVRWTLEQGWPGLENLSSIPGTVGAAPVQNIGAYGLELAERCEAVWAVDLDDGVERRFDAAACGFAYRDSLFKRAPGRYLITRVVFRLPRPWQPVLRYAELARRAAELGPAPDALQLSDLVIAIRRAKLPDPAEIGNAGSFFKNPVVDAASAAALAARWPDMPAYPQPDGEVKLSAGWLIEQAGWKGRSLGAVGVYPKQALVLVNLGGAVGREVLRLARTIGGEVKARFGVDLEIEPVRAGVPGPAGEDEDGV